MKYALALIGLRRGRLFETAPFLKEAGGVLNAFEANRYHVVLRAFDLQEAWKHKKIRLLWETRFSLRERQRDFGLELPAMAQAPSRFFGQDSHGLIQKAPPGGHVEIGEPRSVGDAPAP
jgi:hypothetical protein